MSFSSWSDPSRPARFSARALWLAGADWIALANIDQKVNYGRFFLWLQGGVCPFGCKLPPTTDRPRSAHPCPFEEPEPGMVVAEGMSLPTTIRRRSQSNRPKKSLQLFSIYLFLRFRKARMLAFSKAAAVLGFLPLLDAFGKDCGLK